MPLPVSVCPRLEQGTGISMPRTAVIDLDGTLVDSNYHHTLCWQNALLDHGLIVPAWRLHRHVGMGGDKYVTAVAGEEVESSLGEALRNRWEQLFDEVIDQIQPLPDARELVLTLKERGHIVVVASSAIERHLNVLFDKLAIRDLVDAWTVSDDVGSSKPEPDLIEAALEKAGTRDAVMIGDSPWDIIAADGAGIPTLGLLTGGFSTSELEGAVATYPSLGELRKELPRTVLA